MVNRTTGQSEKRHASRGGRNVNWSLWAGGLITLGVLLVALLGPHLAPRDPLETNPTMRVGAQWLTAPFPPLTVPGFPLGSDPLGRDLLSQVLWAVRPTMTFVLLIATVRMIVGIVVGTAAGWSAGRVGRILDLLIAGTLILPILIVALATIAAFEASWGSMAFVVGLSLTGWAESARVVREQTRVIKGQGYVEAARALGGSGPHIVGYHVLRQLVPLLWVLLALELSSTLALIAGLGFLGYYLTGEVWIAISDTVAQRFSGIPELGQMLVVSIDTLFQGPWRALAAGSTIFIIILGLNLLVEGLRLQVNVVSGSRRTFLSPLFDRVSHGLGDAAVMLFYTPEGRKGFRAGTVALLLLIVAGGGFWWRTQASAQIEGGLLVPGGHWWATERHDPYGTMWTSAEGPRSGAILWQFEEAGGLSGGPAVSANGMLFIASRAGVLYALDPDGGVVWQAALLQAPVGVPALDAAGRVYVAGADGGLTALTAEGQLRWRFAPEESLSATSGPIIAPDGTIFYTVGAAVQALSSEGHALWRLPLSSDLTSSPPHLSSNGEVLFLDNGVLLLDEGNTVAATEMTSFSQIAVGADGLLYLRLPNMISHSLVQARVGEEGIVDQQDIAWSDMRQFVSPARDQGATPNGIIWMAWYFDRLEDAKIAWTNLNGDSLGVANFPHQPSLPIGVDVTGALYTCGTNRSLGAECLVWRVGVEQPLWKLLLPEGQTINGGALAPGRLYVTMEDGILYAIGESQ